MPPHGLIHFPATPDIEDHHLDFSLIFGGRRGHGLLSAAWTQGYLCPQRRGTCHSHKSTHCLFSTLHLSRAKVKGRRASGSGVTWKQDTATETFSMLMDFLSLYSAGAFLIQLAIHLTKKKLISCALTSPDPKGEGGRQVWKKDTIKIKILWPAKHSSYTLILRCLYYSKVHLALI